MSFATVRQLAVWRTFSDGQKVRVGGLAQNREGVFFSTTRPTFLQRQLDQTWRENSELIGP